MVTGNERVRMTTGSYGFHPFVEGFLTGKKVSGCVAEADEEVCHFGISFVAMSE